MKSLISNCIPSKLVDRYASYRDKQPCIFARSFWVLLSALLLVMSLEAVAAQSSGYIPEKLKLMESFSSKKEVKRLSLETEGGDYNFFIFLSTLAIIQVYGNGGEIAFDNFNFKALEGLIRFSEAFSLVHPERGPPLHA